MANRMVLSAKATRNVEYWISLQKMKDVSLPDRRILLLSVLTIATHRWDDKEMKESILALFEVILVKGIDTMSFYLLATKVVFGGSPERFINSSLSIYQHRESQICYHFTWLLSWIFMLSIWRRHCFPDIWCIHFRCPCKACHPLCNKENIWGCIQPCFTDLKCLS